MQEWILSLDYQIFDLINAQWTSPTADFIFFWLTDLHKTLFFKITLVPLVFLAFLYRYRRQGLSVFFFLILFVSISDWTGAQVKRHFERPRPEHNPEISALVKSPAGHYSFYSNHASNMMCFAVFMGAFFAPIRWALILIALSVGYSRVYNGVHYPSDVIAGALAGAFWGILGYKSVGLLQHWIKRRSQSAS